LGRAGSSPASSTNKEGKTPVRQALTGVLFLQGILLGRYVSNSFSQI